MSNINKYFRILEFDKIIDKLKEEVILESNINLLNNIELESELSVVSKMLEEVDEASKLLIRVGRFPLYFKEDITQILTKVNKYGVVIYSHGS